MIEGKKELTSRGKEDRKNKKGKRMGEREKVGVKGRRKGLGRKEERQFKERREKLARLEEEEEKKK